ncbi:RNA polymerase sigma factor [[Clostridium] polysaccharolyticum]|uniref:RNA polymerase sigma-70 factor, ECF subfamily n=1 Tax=[Clostridium] polysaccharolyticum TaxID=29364 RepID=A0A1I0DH49_9FIRM|nr:sigma-70 family RNA polymerase sigma factor [[Clostridium] polysaccharolyticum]SET31110.1 RNA polymerase sigma-70 factor, ECF subfamily [[Clostridium] polysaccharolyticum]
MTIEETYRVHSQTVYRYLLALTHDADLAEELTQETFYQAIRSANQFDESCKVSTWLCAIAKHTLQTYRRKHPSTFDIEEVEQPTASTEVDVLAKLSRVELLKKLHLLEESTREVMYLRLFGDLSFREIGDIVSQSENWARVTFYRGKEKLRKELKKDER